jgi:hypothetical protein
VAISREDGRRWKDFAQLLAQMELFGNPGKYEKKGVHPAQVADEKVAGLHLDKIGVKLTQFSSKQAEYIGVPQSRLFKPDAYTEYRFARPFRLAAIDLPHKRYQRRVLSRKAI